MQLVADARAPAAAAAAGGAAAPEPEPSAEAVAALDDIAGAVEDAPDGQGVYGGALSLEGVDMTIFNH